LTVAGSDVLTLSGPTTYSGPTTVNSGTLATTGAGILGPGPLVVNSSGAASVVNLGNSQAIGGLSSAVSGGGSARVNVAGVTTLTINQTAAGSFAGTVALAAGSPGAGASLVKNGDSPLEIDGGLALGDNSSLAVNAGTLKISVTTGSPSVGNGVVATVSSTGTLELAGSVSALGTAVAANRTSITNTSAATAGVLVSAGNQQVGGIDGLGNVAVGEGASLTADHITAGALAIGGNSALVTIAPSAADGGPLGVARGGLLGVTDGLAEAQAGSAEPFVVVSSLLAPPSAGDAVGPLLADSTAASPDTNAGATSAVPEPASFVLLFLGAAFLFGRLRTAVLG
jgi:fibronectin-binding autotransporter adhesin